MAFVMERKLLGYNIDFPPNLEGDVHRVELDLGLLDLDPHLGLEVGRCNSLQLAGSVRCEATPL